MNKLSLDSPDESPRVTPSENSTTLYRESGPCQKRCLNPVCDNLLEPKRKHAPVKYYCSPKCALDVSAIKRVAKLYGLNIEKVHEVLSRREDAR
jgi:hypothetical protein